MLDRLDLEQLRDIRSRSEMTLKPSPYLKRKFVNDSGEEAEVSIRNYQKIGIMNLLMVPSMLLGDDTGLGKTLEVLSAIGYVWLKEPEYVPIIVTTKSSLFQWEAEVKRFMQDMEVVTVHGEPFKRHEAYEEFFLRHDPSRRRLIIMTYDNVMYDAEESVIRSEPRKAKDLPKGFGKQFQALSKSVKEAKAILDERKRVVQERFSGALLEVQDYVRECGQKGSVEAPFPPGWTDLDTKVVKDCLSAKADWQSKTDALAQMKEQRAPSRHVPGIVGYMLRLRADYPGAKFLLVMDEMHKLKNHKSQFHLKTDAMCKLAERRIGMTATPVKNRLMEFWSLYRILQPDLFPKITAFKGEFCVEKMQRIGGGRQIPVVVGYKNLDEFVRRIEPYYLSRKKHDVAKELPELVSVEVECELSPEQDVLYDMAEAGLLDEMDNPDAQQSDTLRAITACLQACDAPQLLTNDDGEPFEGKSSKLEALIDLLEGSAEGKKVIVYSKFEKMISLIEERLRDEKIKCVRITGKESDPKKRRKAAEEFQRPDSGVDVILLTSAGSESINLQAAEHFVFFDLPWSYGDYLQLVGRMIRIGSAHGMVVAHHFIARRASGDETIDKHILKALKAKKKLADKVAGENLKDALQFTEAQDATLDALASLFEDRKGKQRTDKRLPAKPPRDGRSAAPKKAARTGKDAPDPDEDGDYRPYSLPIDLSDI